MIRATPRYEGYNKYLAMKKTEATKPIPPVPAPTPPPAPVRPNNPNVKPNLGGPPTPAPVSPRTPPPNASSIPGYISTNDLIKQIEAEEAAAKLPPPIPAPSTAINLFDEPEKWSISRFGWAGREDGHYGIDFYTNTLDAHGKHASVFAEWSGEVVGIQTGIPNDAGGRGNYVIIKLDSHYYGADRYMILQHLDVLHVALWQYVEPGTELGTVGDSGAGGIHLHIEMREGLEANNPNTGQVLDLRSAYYGNNWLFFGNYHQYGFNDQ